MGIVYLSNINCINFLQSVVGQYQGQYLRYTQYWILYVLLGDEVDVEAGFEEKSVSVN